MLMEGREKSGVGMVTALKAVKKADGIKMMIHHVHGHIKKRGKKDGANDDGDKTERTPQTSWTE